MGTGGAWESPLGGLAAQRDLSADTVNQLGAMLGKVAKAEAGEGFQPMHQVHFGTANSHALPNCIAGTHAQALKRIIDLRFSPSWRPAALMDAVTAAVVLEMDLAIEVHFEEGPAVQARKRELGQIAVRLEGAVGSALEAVAASATEVQSSAATLAERTQERAQSVSAASGQASANVQTVAAAAEELAASVGEITRQVSDSARIASDAVSRARATDATVQGLAEGARRIGDVVRPINDIAGQTNLLALNATIEAARAARPARASRWSPPR